MAKKVLVEIISGAEGYSISISNGWLGTRVAGATSWGNIVTKFEVDADSIIKAIQENSYEKDNIKGGDIN